SRYPRAISYGVRRCEFDAFLLRRSGARVKTEALRRVERVGDGWILNETLRAPVLIGAGGHFCPVARTLGACASDRPVVVAQEIELRMTPDQERRCRIEAEVPELSFCRDLEGYGWVFRKGAYLNVGFGRRDERAFPAHLHAFWTALAADGRVPEDVPPRWPGH